jgi:hypothetical protein
MLSKLELAKRSELRILSDLKREEDFRVRFCMDKF